MLSCYSRCDIAFLDEMYSNTRIILHIQLYPFHFCPCPLLHSMYSLLLFSRLVSSRLFSALLPSYLLSSLVLCTSLSISLLISSSHLLSSLFFCAPLFSSAGQDVIYTRIKAAQLLEDNLDNAKMAWGAWLGFYNGWVGTL